MVSAPPKAAKPEHVLLTRTAWIGFSGAILAAVITIFPDLRPSGLDRLLDRLADLTAAINGEVITIGPGGGIAHAEAEVHVGDRVTIKNGDDVPHTIVVPGSPSVATAAGNAGERIPLPGTTIHVYLPEPAIYISQCLSCTVVEIRITVLLPGEPRRIAQGDEPPQGGAGESPPGAVATADTPSSTAPAVTLPDQPSLTPPAAGPDPSATATGGDPADPEPTADPGGGAPGPTAGGVVGAPSETPSAPRPPDPTVDPGAVEPPTGPASPVPPQEPVVTPEQPEPQPEPPPEPAADPRPQVCDGLRRKAPQPDIDEAMDDPSAISGWDQLRNPNLPEGPDNPRKHWLSMLDLNKPYHRLFNGLRFKAGCP